MVVTPLYGFMYWVSRPWAPSSPLATTDNIVKRMWLCRPAKHREQKVEKIIKVAVRRSKEQKKSRDHTVHQSIWMRDEDMSSEVSGRTGQ